MSMPLWKFKGFVTDAGNRVVQEWFWNDIGIAERDDIRDRAGYLANVSRHLWKTPHFKLLIGTEIGEIRKKTPNGALRIYGWFSGQTFVLLNGNLKKSDRDNQGLDLARSRLKKLKQGLGSTHEFSFEERPP